MTLIQYSIKKINDMSKKQKFTYLIIISLFVIAIVLTRVTHIQADILQILEVRSYTVKNVSSNIYDKDQNLSVVSGYIYKEKEVTKKPYALLIVDFYKNGKKVDSKSISIETLSLKEGEKREFEVMTDVEFDDYRYYIE